MISESRPTRADCRPQFQLTVRRWRSMATAFAAILIPAFFLIGWRWSQGEEALWLILLCVTMVALLLGRFYLPALDCPNCGEQADLPPTKFCPECGEPSLEEHGRLLTYMKCRACLKELKKRKNHRLYIIRFCNHCGAHLDDHGV